MSDDIFGFAPPPFDPEQALQRLKRDLRGLGLSEREGAFERRSLQMARAAVVDGELQAAIAKVPARSPQWQPRKLSDSAALRQFLADLKKQMAIWNERDE